MTHLGTLPLGYTKYVDGVTDFYAAGWLRLNTDNDTLIYEQEYPELYNLLCQLGYFVWTSDYVVFPKQDSHYKPYAHLPSRLVTWFIKTTTD